uniref:G-protein coupled receptors family 1 profile domain-containing protein n=1 Tax=Anas platyrhynchos platyrhynchos TaxID=8840 RepID=U3I6C8_ANAPP
MENSSLPELNSSCAPGHKDCTGRGDEGLNMPPPLLSSSFYITVPVIYSITCAVGLTGNTAVIYVILKAPKIKTVTNIFILNLAIADKLFTLVLPINIVDYLLLQWPFGEFMCKLIISIDQYNNFSSIYFLTIMSLDHYLVVVATTKPRKMSYRTYQAVKIVSLCIWSFVTVIILPFIVFAKIHKEQGRSQLRLHSNAKALDKAKKKVTLMVAVTLAVCLFCWTPYHLSTVVALTIDIPQTPLIIGISYFIASLSYTNSSLNPFLYAFLDDSF